MNIRDRIIDLRRVPAAELIPNPRNWRTHPQRQQDALRGLLAEVGIADALLARETPDGLMLIDGHLRAETLGSQAVPVLVLDVTEDEANKLLATVDPLAAMAGTDGDKLITLLHGVNSGSDAVQEMLEALASPYLDTLIDTAEPPEDFPEVDENIKTTHTCPSCGYEFS